MREGRTGTFSILPLSLKGGKRTGLLCVLCSGIFLLFFPSMLSGFPKEVVDRIMAVVNDRVITKWEIDSQLGPSSEALGFTGKQKERELEQLRIQRLLRMIEDEILYQAGKSAGFVPSKEEVDLRIQEKIRQAGSKAKFLKILSDQELDIRDVEEEVEKEITGSKYVASRWWHIHGNGKELRPREDVEVTPAEMRRYYSEHRQEFTREDRAKVRVIFLPFTGSGNAAKVWERGREILKMLEEGEDFGTLASQFSFVKRERNGDIGWIGRNSNQLNLIKDFAFQNPMGSVSPLLESPEGLWILKTEEREEQVIIPFSEAQERIAELVRNEKKNASFRRERKRLLQEATIWPQNIKELLLSF